MLVVVRLDDFAGEIVAVVMVVRVYGQALCRIRSE
jgi:hypothetical protein